MRKIRQTMRPELSGLPFVVGVDPGRSAAVALVEDSPRGTVLRGCWSVYGSDSPWDIRLLRSMSALPSVRITGLGGRAAIETPAIGGASSRILRGATWGSLMFRVGLIHARLQDLGWKVEHVPSMTWTKGLGCRKGKGDNPGVRIDAASVRVRGFSDHVSALPLKSKSDHERRVCAAEATLIAAWQLAQLRGQA